ncbi:MAG: hypothetical protein ABR598_04650 [Candidatus Dormibacteria bacterium]
MAVGGLALSSYISSSRTTSQPGLQASAFPGADPGDGDTASGGQGQVVGGIPCEKHEQVAFHQHAHLFILRDGIAQPVSANVGIPGGALLPKCLYWLHTHDRTGVVHIEAPGRRSFSLGQFFDIWGRPLSSDNVARLTVPASQFEVFVDGKPFTDDPRTIALKDHTQVVIEIGRQVEPPSFDFQGN